MLLDAAQRAGAWRSPGGGPSGDAVAAAVGVPQCHPTGRGVVGDAREQLGYRRPGAHDVVRLDDDPTANPACAAAWAAVTSVGLPAGVREVAIRGNDDGEALIALVAAVPARAPRGPRAGPRGPRPGPGASHAARPRRGAPAEGDPGDPLETGHALVRAGVAGVALAPYDPRGRFRGGAQRLAGARSLRQRYGDVEITLTATAFAQPNPGRPGRSSANWRRGRRARATRSTSTAATG